MNWSLYISFLGMAVLVLLAPGPSLAYAVALAGRASRREAVLNAVGMGIGGLLIVLALALGAARLLHELPVAYSTLKLVGCIYLIALGVQTMRSAPTEPGRDLQEAPTKWPTSPLLQGVLVETANPKAILFYAAFIPQFVDGSLGHEQGQLLTLGATFVCLQVTWDAALMLSLQHCGHRLNTALSVAGKAWVRRASGCMFVAVGLLLLRQDGAGTAAESSLSLGPVNTNCNAQRHARHCPTWRSHPSNSHASSIAFHCSEAT